MPAFKIDLGSDEVQARLGEFKEAAREARREWQELERGILNDVRAGNKVQPERAEKLEQLRAKENFYLEKDHERTFRKALGTDREGSLVGTIRKINSFFNVHSPHGAVRSMLSGRIGEHQIKQLGGALEFLGEKTGSEALGAAGGEISAAAGTAGPIGQILGRITRFAIETQAQRYQNAEQAAKSDLQRYSVDFEQAYGRRYDLSAQTEQYLVGRRAALAGQFGTIENNYTNAGYGAFSGITSWLNNGKDVAAMKERQQKIYDALNAPGSILAGQNARGLADYSRNLDRAEVERRFTYTEKGLWGYLKSNTLDRLTGQRERERAEYAQELAEKQVETLQTKLEAEQKAYNDNPQNLANERERNHWLRAVEHAEIIKFNSIWNPI